MIWQKTLAQPLNFSGIGLHSGKRVEVTLHPASANQGLRFIRTDLPNRPHILRRIIPVWWTPPGPPPWGITALPWPRWSTCWRPWGLGVDNALIEVHGPELPIMDGSAAPFARLISRTGLRNLSWPRAYLMVRETVELRRGEQWMRVRPGVPRITYTIDFDHPLIRRQRYTVPLRAESFQSEIAPARTFGFLKEVQYLQARGLARGGSAGNAVVFDEVGVLIRGPALPGRVRAPQDPGNAGGGGPYLAGLPVLGHLEVGKGSHGTAPQLHATAHEPAGGLAPLDSLRRPGEEAGTVVPGAALGGGHGLGKAVVSGQLRQARGGLHFCGGAAVSGRRLRGGRRDACPTDSQARLVIRKRGATQRVAPMF